MKTGAAIALIIVGGMLILGPLVADYFNQAQHQANAMRVVETTKASDENKLFYLRDRYPMGVYPYLCLGVGVAMVLVGIWGALKRLPWASASRVSEEQPITSRSGG